MWTHETTPARDRLVRFGDYVLAGQEELFRAGASRSRTGRPRPQSRRSRSGGVQGESRSTLPTLPNGVTPTRVARLQQPREECTMSSRYAPRAADVLHCALLEQVVCGSVAMISRFVRTTTTQQRQPYHRSG